MGGKPTFAEVVEHFISSGFRANPKEFYAHCERNGWKDAKGKPIVSWRAYAKAWNTNVGVPAREPQPAPEKPLFDERRLIHCKDVVFPRLSVWVYDGHVLDVPGEADYHTALAAAQHYFLRKLASGNRS